MVTLDADFHAIIALSGLTAPSVIRVRMEGLRAAPLGLLLADVLQKAGVALQSGALVTIDSDRIRVRQLPVATPGSAGHRE